MNAQAAATLQVLLEGIPLPASRSELLAYARSQDAAAAETLRDLPEGSYDRLDAVGEALTRPRRAPGAPPHGPRAESGKPPGGSAYLDAGEDSGRVRRSAPRSHPPKKAIGKQSQLKQKQRSVQQDG